MSPQPFDSRNGWTLYQHPAFREQFDALVAEVENLFGTLHGKHYEEHPKVRFLARVVKIILDDVPHDPTSRAYVQGNTLGAQRRHWRRVKSNQRFRIFFRFHSKHRLIVYAWMNDENTLRTRGARNDVCAAFAQRLE